jgi:hypothetical protein
VIVDSPQLVQDQVATLEQGMDSGRAPTLVQQDECAYLENGTVRGGYAKNRSSFQPIALGGPGLAVLANNIYQGCEIYDIADDLQYLMVMAGGHLLQTDLSANTVTDVTPDSGMTPGATMCWMCQADVYFCVEDGNLTPYIWQYGQPVRRALNTELPVGRQMAYGQGRLWLAQGRAYVAGDILGGPTSVVSFTENTYIATATNFSVPLQSGDIVGMTFIEVGDTSTGQGELLVVARNAIWSVHTTLTTRDQWNVTPGMITIGLCNIGGTGQRNLVDVNSDMFFRSKDGERSYRMARNVQLYSQWGWGAGGGGFWGYTPVSREMTRIVSTDTLPLLDFCSSALFNNRLLTTANPVKFAPGSPPYFSVIMALDFDVVSSIGQKLPPAWDGAWTGLHIYELKSGLFNGVYRCFAFVRNPATGATELWELRDDLFFDNQNVPITTTIETRALDCQKPVNPKQIRTGKLYFTNVLAATEVTVSYRSDGYTTWIPWHDFEIMAAGSDSLPGQPAGGGTLCNIPLCTVPGFCPSPELQSAGGYWFAQALPMPDTTCDPITKKLLRNGYHFQFQIQWKGPATLEKFVLYCDELVEDPNGNCAPNPGL